jgi:tRNA 2-(methylsulfanyl)-N6-isopentenyladenosine37 hydroxylase
VPRPPQIDLPLLIWTPREWAAQALRDPLALLNDHAHLERKAAANALELLLRWPEPAPPENWVLMMTAIARDEIDHLAIVTKILARQGGRLVKNHRNPYANALRELVRLGDGRRELMDRLMICALIEARSCERFELLSRCCEQDTELKR